MLAFVGFGIGFVCLLLENYRFFIRLFLSVLKASLVAISDLKEYLMHQTRVIFNRLKNISH